MLQIKIKEKIFVRNENGLDPHLDSLFDLALLESHMDQQKSLQTIEEIKEKYEKEEKNDLNEATFEKRLGELMLRLKDRTEESILHFNNSLKSYEKLIESLNDDSSLQKVQIYENVVVVLNHLAQLMFEKENHTEMGKKKKNLHSFLNLFFKFVFCPIRGVFE